MRQRVVLWWVRVHGGVQGGPHAKAEKEKRNTCCKFKMFECSEAKITIFYCSPVWTKLWENWRFVARARPQQLRWPPPLVPPLLLPLPLWPPPPRPQPRVPPWPRCRPSPPVLAASPTAGAWAPRTWTVWTMPSAASTDAQMCAWAEVGAKYKTGRILKLTM